MDAQGVKPNLIETSQKIYVAHWAKTSKECLYDNFDINKIVFINNFLILKIFNVFLISNIHDSNFR